MDFVINSACIPMYSISSAFNKASEVFTAYMEYISNKEIPILNSDTELNELIIAKEQDNKASFYDFLDSTKADIDFYSSIQDIFDRCHVLEESEKESLYDYFVKIGDDTRFEKNLSLRYAFINSCILLSITDEKFWQRSSLKDSTDSGIYNLYSEDISFLPFEIPPFTLHDESRFRKTSRYNKNSVIFQELSTGYYWYEDKFHHNTKPHFEVFDEEGNHVGEADMKGIIHINSADKDKKLEL